VTVAEAQAKLKELIDKLAPGEEIVITDNQQPVAALVGKRSARPATSRTGVREGQCPLHGP
jgi:prevent-host-death family protein